MQNPTYENIPGNYYDKFNASNPAVRWIMRGFRHGLQDLLAQTTYQRVLEIGCGEGHIQALLQMPGSLASDIDLDILIMARQRFAATHYFLADGTAMPLPSGAFDLVLAIEVLEHVPAPERLLREAIRLSQRYCIFSVPREPLWRALNMARGKYLAAWGNTPGHINHWSTNAFLDFVASQAQIVAHSQPFPWTMVLCEVN
ncbi:MAG: class I SAM-dependent methyltransferase [Anaerolineales bacterium]